MKKVIIPILLILVIGIVFVINQFVKPVNLEFTKTITLNYEYGDKNIHVNITDESDFKTLISISKGTAVNDFSIPSCGFGTAELVFEGNGKRTVLYPACDGCSTMRFGKEDKYFWDIGVTNREKLVEILKKYGATFPCV